MSGETSGCNGCDKRWGGQLTCHCAACHETFTTVSNFDKHRHYEKCKPPQSRGLVVGARGLWCQPREDD